MDEPLVSFRAVDEPGVPCSPGQAAVTDRALELAQGGLDQGAIIAALKQEFPGRASENHYLNPAAIALMQVRRHRAQEREGLEADKARLRKKGLPQSLAGGQRP